MQQNNPYAAPAARVVDAVVDGAPMLAERMTRLGAVILDGVFALIALLPMFIDIFRAAGGLQAGMANPDYGALSMVGAVLFLGLFVYNLVLLARNGQTLGKKILGIKIVRTDGSKAGLGRIFWLRMVLNAVIGVVPVLGVIYQIADPLFIFGDARRCLHDRLADTIVVVA